MHQHRQTAIRFMFTVSEPAPPRHRSLVWKTPVSIARDALDFRKLIRAGETVGWAEATAEPLLLTRLLDAHAERCSPFRVFFPLTFSDSLAAGHPNVTVTALGGAGAGRRFFAGGADNVVPANISDVPGLVASGWLPIDIVLLQVRGPDDAGRYNARLGIEHLRAAIGRRLRPHAAGHGGGGFVHPLPPARPNPPRQPRGDHLRSPGRRLGRAAGELDLPQGRSTLGVRLSQRAGADVR